MGNEHPQQAKKGKPVVFNKNIDKNKLDILLKQVFFTAQLNKDRKKGQQNTREKELLNLVRQPANKRAKDNEYSKASAIVNDIKSVKAHECVMRYADILKDNAMVIQMSKGDTSKIMDLVPYVESMIWGCQKCNVECIKQFEQFIIENFGLDTYNSVMQFTKVTPEIKNLFTSILPTEREVKLYLIDFCNRNGISLDVMNEIGHSLSPTELADLPDPNSKPSPSPSNQGSQGQQGQGQGGFPNNNNNNYQPGFQPGFPGPGGPTQVYSGSNQPYPGQYNPGPYPQYPQYPQQGGYPGQYPGNYPQYPPQQGGYPQDNFGGYPNNYGGGFGQPNSQQQGFPQGGQGSYQMQPPTYQPQNITVNIGVPNENSMNAPSQNGGGGAYPGFQKFNEAPQAGGKSGYDPLDELDVRLKNIKDGL